jgi:hypothetical protein
MGLLRLLHRVTLVLVALTAVGRGTGTNYLQPIFTSMGSQRYATPPPADPRLAATGDVRVVAVDNPQVLAAGGDAQAALDDVLAIKPAIDAPASATVAVSLSAGAASIYTRHHRHHTCCMRSHRHQFSVWPR